MLSYLQVRNLAVVEEASVDFAGGLCVLTGETGAGKSLVIDSLNLLGGVRATADLIRTGAETLTVTGIFRAPSNGTATLRELLEAAGVGGEGDEGDELVVRREVSRTGRNRVFVNDQPVTLALLVAIAPHLLRIHGQRDELGLIAPELQRALVDRQGKASAEELLREVALAFQQYRTLADRLARLSGDERARSERVDLLRYQLDEIQAAAVGEGEEVSLREERDTLRYAEEIAGALGDAVLLLSDAEEGAAVADLAHARSALLRVAEWLGDAPAWLAELDELMVRTEELASNLRRRLGSIDAEPGRLDQVEERLALLERLLRKYGGSSVEVLRYAAVIEEELGELTWDDEKRTRLESEVAAALERYRVLALELSERRAAWARELALGVEAQLAELALPSARFAVRCERRPIPDGPLRVEGQSVEFGPDGLDTVTFDFSPNPGEELRPLAKVASGGELARVYLALQVAAGTSVDATAPPVTLVFDEVDAGLGGAQAAVVGRKLHSLARAGQILAVTHLPQVACRGDVHFRVKKHVRGERTVVAVEALAGEARVEELARMLAGEAITEVARDNARELLAAAREREPLERGSADREPAAAGAGRKRKQ